MALWTLRSWKLLWTLKIVMNLSEQRRYKLEFYVSTILFFRCGFPHHPYFLFRCGPGFPERKLSIYLLLSRRDELKWRWKNEWQQEMNEFKIHYQFISCCPLEMNHSRDSFRLRTSTPQAPKSTQRARIQKTQERAQKTLKPPSRFWKKCQYLTTSDNLKILFSKKKEPWERKQDQRLILKGGLTRPYVWSSAFCTRTVHLSMWSLDWDCFLIILKVPCQSSSTSQTTHLVWKLGSQLKNQPVTARFWKDQTKNGYYWVAAKRRVLQIIDLFAQYCLFYRALMQKRPIILRNLLIVAIPYWDTKRTRNPE